MHPIYHILLFITYFAILVNSQGASGGSSGGGGSSSGGGRVVYFFIDIFTQSESDRQTTT